MPAKGRSGYIEDKIANKHGGWYMYDLGLMTQNRCLAAHSLGLGAAVVGWYDLEEAERILDCPDDVEVVTLIPMGYRVQKGHVPTHRPIAEFVHTNYVLSMIFIRKENPKYWPTPCTQEEEEANTLLTQTDDTFVSMAVAFGAVLGLLVQGHLLNADLSGILMRLVKSRELPFHAVILLDKQHVHCPLTK